MNRYIEEATVEAKTEAKTEVPRRGRPPKTETELETARGKRLEYGRKYRAEHKEKRLVSNAASRQRAIDAKKYACTICDRAFSAPSMLKYHMSVAKIHQPPPQ